MIRFADRGSHIDADLGLVVLGCIVALVALVIAEAVVELRRTQWWEDRVAPLIHLPWCRIKAAGRVLRGRPAWLCGLCRTPVALEHDTCRRCTLWLREAFRHGERVFDQEAPNVP